MNRVILLLVIGFGLGLSGLGAAQETVIYSTTFGQGYDSRFELAGQQGWVKFTDPDSTGGNGLITDFDGSQAAYVGLFDLQPPGQSIYVWQPLNYTPVVSQAPVVKFSTVLYFVDSTTTNRDDFFWSIYNTDGNHLFTIDFNNFDLGIYYILDGTNDWEYSGAVFENEIAYTLQLSLDFARNRWSASLSGTNILAELPITTTAAPLTLGDIDAVWAVFDSANPGDNFMIFDNYRVVAESLVPRATLSSLSRATNGDATLLVAGQSGSRYAVEASTNLVNWVSLRTNLVIDTSFEFTDTAAGALEKRFYRARRVP